MTRTGTCSRFPAAIRRRASTRWRRRPAITSWTRNSMAAVLSSVNIIEKTDEEILALARPLWRDLVKASNEGKYGEFSKHFSSAMARTMDQVMAGHQFANSELARNLS